MPDIANMISFKEMTAIEINALSLGIKIIDLMENAGKSVYEEMKNRFNLKNKKVVIFCGSGNNGGDGFVLARYLKEKENLNVTVAVMKEPKTKEAEENLKKIVGKVDIVSFERGLEIATEADFIVDAILGIGIKGELREPIKSVVEKLNKIKAVKISIDVPTGIGGSTFFKPDIVVTFHKAKEKLEDFNYVVKDIGIPKEAEEFVGIGDVYVHLAKRRENSHKGMHGKVLIIGGSSTYYGAPILSAEAALNGGADLVYLLVPEVNYDITRSYMQDFIVKKYSGGYLNKDAVDVAVEVGEKCDVIAVGMGIGTEEETRNALFEIIEELKDKTFVIDADAIKILSEDVDLLKKINCVLTPHAGEFKILSKSDLPDDIEERKNVVLNFAKKIKSTILLKSRVDIIAKNRVRLNKTGNAGMTVGGTGDVLSGLVAGFLAQGIDDFSSACIASFVNGYAGDMLYEEVGYFFKASDLVKKIPYAIRTIINKVDELRR